MLLTIPTELVLIVSMVVKVVPKIEEAVVSQPKIDLPKSEVTVVKFNKSKKL